MSIGLTQVQQQKLAQRTTQRQMLLMHLVSISKEELEEEIAKAVETNPALEIAPDEESEEGFQGEGETEEWDNEPQEVSYEEAMNLGASAHDDDAYDTNPDDWEPGGYDTPRYDNGDLQYEKPVVATTSFREDLISQLGELALSDTDRRIAIFIIGSLSDQGYFEDGEDSKNSARSIVNQLLIQENIRVTKEDVIRVLTEYIQTLEPTGIGARSVQECLLLQINAALQQKKTPQLLLARTILTSHFDHFTKRRFDLIAKREKISVEQVQEAVAIITRLNVYPGGGSETTNYVVPDFIVMVEGEKVTFTLARQYKARLRVSNDYEKLMQQSRTRKDPEAAKFYRETIDKARLFIDALTDRERTMTLVMNEIITQQKEYFLTGDPKQLKPMVLKNIAEKVKMDVATVSRVTAQRYAQTPFGTISLKSLFSEAVNEEDASANAIKQALKEIVEGEDKRAPYTDEKLVQLLQEKGYSISRRTVTKYREKLGILSTSKRKER